MSDTGLSHTGQLERARLLLDAGRAAEARSALTSYVAADPDNADAWCLLARAHLGDEEPARALDAASRAIELAPDDEWGHRVASLAYDALGDAPRAVAAATESVRLLPTHWAPHVRYAMAAADIWDLRGQAWQAATYAVSIAPHEPETHFAVGYVALEFGDLVSAERAFRQTLALDPSHAAARHNLAVVDMRRGRYGAAASGFGGALTADPTLSESRRNLDVAVLHMVRNMHVVLWVGLIVVAGVSPDEDGSPGPPRWVLPLVLTALVATTVYFFRRVTSGLSPALRPYLARLPRTNPWIGAWALCLVVAFVALVSVVVLPPVGGLVAIGVAGMALILGCVISWLRVAAERLRR